MNNVKNNIKCNICKSDMKVKLKKRQITNNVNEVYLQCDECGYKYHVCYEDEEVRILRERLNKAKKNKKSYSTVIRIQKMIRNKMIILENEMVNGSVKYHGGKNGR